MSSSDSTRDGEIQFTEMIHKFGTKFYQQMYIIVDSSNAAILQRWGACGTKGLTKFHAGTANVCKNIYTTKLNEKLRRDYIINCNKNILEYGNFFIDNTLRYSLINTINSSLDFKEFCDINIPNIYTEDWGVNIFTKNKKTSKIIVSKKEILLASEELTALPDFGSW